MGNLLFVFSCFLMASSGPAHASISKLECEDARGNRLEIKLAKSFGARLSVTQPTPGLAAGEYRMGLEPIWGLQSFETSVILEQGTPNEAEVPAWMTLPQPLTDAPLPEGRVRISIGCVDLEFECHAAGFQ